MNTKRKTLKMPVRYLMNTVLVALLFLGLSYLTGNLLSTYQNKVLMTVGINIILAVSLNVATGYLGQLPLGHAGFMAVGAYTCALFTKYSPLPSGISFAIGLVLACIMAGLFGVLIGIPALRLTGDYLAILTLGFGEIIRITLNNIDDVLGYSLFYGSKGLKNIPKYSHFSNVFLCVVITCFLIHAMMKSRHGRAVLAIRDNEIAAESCGIQTTYYKVMAFAFSAAFAGLAGGLYACYIGVLNPSTFGFMKSIEILVMVVLGGMGSMLGSILSATVLTILPEATRSFDSYRMVIYSLVLILMMIFRPGGLLGSYDFSVSRIVEKVLNGELFRKKNKEGGLRVYAKALKRYVSLVVWCPMDRRTDKWQLYFSTDDSMNGREVLDYYRTRFQLEFCFRDGKQHAGITNCQSIDFRKLDFHFNASLAAVNLAKAACKRLGITYSISSCKSFIHNAYMLERFICVFGINPDMQVIDRLFKELILFTTRAA